jgi:hypothetical protein
MTTKLGRKREIQEEGNGGGWDRLRCVMFWSLVGNFSDLVERRKESVTLSSHHGNMHVTKGCHVVKSETYHANGSSRKGDRN